MKICKTYTCLRDILTVSRARASQSAFNFVRGSTLNLEMSLFGRMRVCNLWFAVEILVEPDKDLGPRSRSGERHRYRPGT